MLVSLIEVPSWCQVFIGNIYNRFEQQVIISHVSLCFYTISLYKTRKCTPRWHILGVVLQTDAVCLWRVGSILFITVFVVPDFTTTISINCCGWISNFIGFTWFYCMFYCLLFWFTDILPWFAHRTAPKTFAWTRPQILLMQKVTKLKQRYGHEAAWLWCNRKASLKPCVRMSEIDQGECAHMCTDVHNCRLFQLFLSQVHQRAMELAKVSFPLSSSVSRVFHFGFLFREALVKFAMLEDFASLVGREKQGVRRCPK